MSGWIIDTGPLVAWFCPKDVHHVWSRATLGSFEAGGLVCEAVIAETCHLVQKDGVDPARVLEFIERGALHPVALTERLRSVRDRMQKYRDQQMDFGDACVMELGETNPNAWICTVDSDFRVYRFNSGGTPRLLAPF